MSDISHLGNINLEPGPILVTGAAGFVGCHLMKELGMGEGDIAVDITTDFEAPEGVSKIGWNLPSQPPEELGFVRYIIHLAAMSSVSKSLKEIHKAYEINLMGTISVLEYMVSKCPGAKMLLASSSEVYKSTDDLISEKCEIGPRNPYGTTKAAAEIAAFQFARNYKLDIVIARAFPHLGPGQSGDFAFPSFCRRIINTRQSGNNIIRVGNLSPVRDYLYVTDVARAYRYILSRGQSGSVYNICTGIGNSIGDMVRMLIDISGMDIKLETDPDLFRPVDVEFQVGDPSRLRSLLGWKPEVDRIEGLRKLFSWWEAKL
ncbi:MAG: NAD-dependent epimerase/dehydratase family protein [Candidatus Aegiribacteria sp.]|nr:NAD-dependent epimerase/dehydratase family protein [Candidatus Aegiribacteria sp.]